MFVVLIFGVLYLVISSSGNTKKKKIGVIGLEKKKKHFWTIWGDDATFCLVCLGGLIYMSCIIKPRFIFLKIEHPFVGARGK